jgi:hypothetical protein
MREKPLLLVSLLGLGCSSAGAPDQLAPRPRPANATAVVPLKMLGGH